MNPLIPNLQEIVVKAQMLENTELCKLLTYHGSDKGDVVNGHNYSVLYSYLFRDLRLKDLNFFELGLGTNDPTVPSSMGPTGKPGASLRAWRDYFPNAQVYGADIDKNILFQENRIKTFWTDQTNRESILELWNQFELRDIEFDIILDDGLHKYEAQMNFARYSRKKLRSGGIYIIEDVHDSYADTLYRDLITKVFENPESHLIKLPCHSAKKDNNLIVVRENQK